MPHPRGTGKAIALTASDGHSRDERSHLAPDLGDPTRDRILTRPRRPSDPVTQRPLALASPTRIASTQLQDDSPVPTAYRGLRLIFVGLRTA
jgi:hypothetical protein